MSFLDYRKDCRIAQLNITKTLIGLYVNLICKASYLQFENTPCVVFPMQLRRICGTMSLKLHFWKYRSARKLFSFLEQELFLLKMWCLILHVKVLIPKISNRGWWPTRQCATLLNFRSTLLIFSSSIIKSRLKVKNATSCQYMQCRMIHFRLVLVIAWSLLQK